MLRIGTLTAVLVATAEVLQAQGGPQYREFQLGAQLRSVSTLAGVGPSAATTVHQRPAVIQKLEWRQLHSLNTASEPQNDPVQRIVFSFYNDQLFRMVVDYDRQRTDGRQLDREKKEAADILAAQEKARLANKAAFRP